MTKMGLYDIPDHPVIRNCERTGWPTGKEPDYPVCPVCDDEPSTVYFDTLNNLIGCDTCIEKYSTEEGDGDCPECGASEPEYFYKKDGAIIGCEHCISEKDAWEWTAENKQEAEEW